MRLMLLFSGKKTTTRHGYWPGLLTVLLAAALILTALPTATAAPAAQTPTVLRIGYLGPAGTNAANGAQLTIDQINGAGGFTGADGTEYQFELLTLAAAPTIDSLAQDLKAFAAQDVIALIGPDTNAVLSAENIENLVNTGLPVLTGATFVPLTDDDTDDVFFRIRAPENVYSEALADYLVDDLELDSVALVQTNVQSTEALLAFDAALQANGISAAARIQVDDAAALDARLGELLDVNPEAVVMWGGALDAGNLLTNLRDAGWDGRFAYRFAAEAAQANLLPADYVGGVLGVNAWSFASDTQASQVFLEDYITTFGEVPGPLSAAAYDAMWLLRAAIISGGTGPDELRAALLGLDTQTIVQGALRPAEYGNGDLVRVAVVYALTPGGGAAVVARYDGGLRSP